MLHRLKRHRSKFGFGITSKFLNLPFVLSIFLCLAFANYLIISDDTWIYNLLITPFIFFINFYLGYHTVRALLLRDRHRSYIYQIFFFFLLSYSVVPLVATYLSAIIDSWGWFSPLSRNFFELFILIFGVNLLVNTFLLIIYYTNSSIVVFEESENTHSHSQKLDALTKNGGDDSQINVRESNSSNIEKNDGQNIEDIKEYLLLKSNRVLTRVQFNEIVYLEVSLNTVLIQTVKRFYETRSTLGEIVKNLPEKFVQINKSIVINLDFFAELTFESDTKRSKVKIFYPGDEGDIEESFYVGRKFLALFKVKLSK